MNNTRQAVEIFSTLLQTQFIHILDFNMSLFF